MIRINLLPGARKQTSSAKGGTQGWIVAYVFAALITGIVLALFYFDLSGQVDTQQAQNRALQQEIARLSDRSAKIEEVRAQLEYSRNLEQEVADLQRARYGPTDVLMEISRILSAGGGPTVDPQRLEEIRRNNPLATYNPSWDPRRLWVTEFLEQDRDCHIKGVGRTNEDVAEFLRRLTLSDSFSSVRLVKTQGMDEPSTRLPVIAFELTCRVIY